MFVCCLLYVVAALAWKPQDQAHDEIMRTIAGFQESFSTAEKLNWPSDIPYVLAGQRIFFCVEESLDLLGIKEHVKLRGWKKIETFLAEQDIKEAFIADGLKKSLLSHAAFVSILHGFNVGQKSTKFAEERKTLKWHLLEKLHGAELKEDGKTPSPKRKTPGSTQTTPGKGSQPSNSFTGPGATPLSSKENISPIKHLLNSPVKAGKCSSELFGKERVSHAEHISGRRWKSRPLMNRVRIQENTFSILSRRIHRGSKDDFLAGLACSVVPDDERTLLPETNKWNGKFSVQDIINLTKLINSNDREETVYDILTEKHAAERHHMTANDILQVEDNSSASDAIAYVRRKFPGLISTSYAVDTLKNNLKKECESVLKPERCATGWKIQADRLHTCLKFVYPWLQEAEFEWWKLYGDARTYGKQKSVAVAIGNLNNEHVLNGCSYQSPKEMWPICLFYGGDSRLNLELNLDGDSSWLSNWVASMETSGHSMFVIGDSMFLDAMGDTKLDPTSKDRFSLYNHETVDTKGKVDQVTGLRSGLGRKIDRDLPHAILKGLPTERYVLCCDHMMTRMTESLLTRKVKSIYDMEAKSMITKRERDNLVQHLESNINTRGVRGGHFKFLFEAGKNKLEQVSLNKTCAQLISAPPSFFKNASYPHILDGVSQDVLLPKPLPSSLQQALGWSLATITEFDCESLLWEHHFNMHEINRMEPTPVLVDEAKKGSSNVNDYLFGVTDEKIRSYIKSADIFHGLVCYRYGSDALTPYMTKCIDIVPIFLESLPFKSMMRMSTEGGERMHYMHQQRFFQHSSRGGGWVYQDPILTVFNHMYRQIRERVRGTDEENVQKFEAFVKECVEGKHNDGLAFAETSSTANSSLGPLSGKRFALVGSFASIKLSHDKLKDVISNKGGQVFNITSIPEQLPVNMIVVSTQKECDKASASPGITTAYQRNWSIISPQFVLDAKEGQEELELESYLLCLDKIQAAPGTSAVHTKVATVAETHFKRCGAFRDLKQTLHCRAEGIERQSKPAEPPSKRNHHKRRTEALKRPPTAFAMFVKEMFAPVSANHPDEELSFKELQSILAEMYKRLPAESKEAYRQKGHNYFDEVNKTFI